MKTKIITILVLMSLLISTIGITGSANQTYSITDIGPDPSKTIEVVKLIKNNTEWVPILEATVGSIVRFKINVTYHDTDGEEGKGFILQDIKVKDTLPSGLEYANSATLNNNPSEPIVSSDGKNITWNINQNLEDNESHIIEFNVLVIDTDEQINKVNVSGIEHCYGEERWGNADATVIGIPGLDAKYKDVDDDETDEIALNDDGNSSNGYEKFIDPDEPSEAVLSTDGDSDGKIDHFIDINKDGRPDRYWDPDDDVLTNIQVIDVDYDGTDEWVYDSNGDGKPDKYYDPSDEKIYPYIAYTLTVNSSPISSGYVIIEPTGAFSPKYLKGFKVTLSAEAYEGWKFVKYTGAIDNTNKIVTVTMDSDKKITALFEKEQVLPTVEIIRPTPYHKYLFNFEGDLDEYKPKIIGPIKVIANATSDKEIDRVEFYLDDEPEPRHTDNSDPYTWFWFFKPLGAEENFTIRVIAYDKENNSNTASIDVTRVRLLSKIIFAGLVIGGLSLLKNRKTPPPDETRPVEPNINKKPVVDTGGPYSGVVGKPVKFDASKSYDPDGTIASYSWDFGDDSKGSEITTSHTYNKAGRYMVKLTVTDSDGSSTTASTYVEIKEKTEGLPYEADIFWYIVSSLATGLIVLVGLLFYRRRLYV